RRNVSRVNRANINLIAIDLTAPAIGFLVSPDYLVSWEWTICRQPPGRLCQPGSEPGTGARTGLTGPAGWRAGVCRPPFETPPSLAGAAACRGVPRRDRLSLALRYPPRRAGCGFAPQTRWSASCCVGDPLR